MSENEQCHECGQPILAGQSSTTSYRSNQPPITHHLNCWKPTPLPEFVLAGETEALAWAREAYVCESLGAIDYWEACGCANCHLDLLASDARSIALDLLVAELHRPAATVEATP